MDAPSKHKRSQSKQPSWRKARVRTYPPRVEIKPTQGELWRKALAEKRVWMYAPGVKIRRRKMTDDAVEQLRKHVEANKMP
jgi:hypothetical protein